MKIIIFPFFRFPTGHSKVAEALEERIVEMNPGASVETVDFLTYCNTFLGRFVSSFYMAMINRIPHLYEKAYRKLVMEEQTGGACRSYRVSPIYFERKMMSLLAEKKPDLVIFTHSFPSSIYARLVRKGKVQDIPSINAYTDFFINDIWAKREITYHFVPHQGVKHVLTENYGVDEHSVFVTGIPIKKVYKQPMRKRRTAIRHVLVAGGNTGLFDSASIAELLQAFPDIKFTLLCGNNQKYMKQLNSLGCKNAVVHSYIDSCEEMNRLYEEADAILTKPGGVTISEALYKQLPIFICNHLPGQEQFNLDHLTEEGVAMEIDKNTFTEDVLWNENKISRLLANMERYVENQHWEVESALARVMLKEFPETRQAALPKRWRMRIAVPAGTYSAE